MTTTPTTQVVEELFIATSKEDNLAQLNTYLDNLGRVRVVSIQQLDSTSRLLTPNSYEFRTTYLIATEEMD